MGTHYDATLTVAFAIIVGIVSSIIADRLKLSSLFFYLLFGMLLGPSGLGFLHPEALGQGLEGLVSLAVAIILFEGAIELDFSHISAMRKVIRNLLTIGVAITLIGGTLAAFFIVGMSWELAILYGAIMTVTGPTVIRPILRRVNLEKPLGPILHWEGILIDPIGAIMAVFLFEIIISEGATPGISLVALGKSVLAGTLVGTTAGFLYAESLRRRVWAHGEQRNIGAIAAALFIYAAAEYFSRHSGLIAVVMGGLFVGWRAPREREEILRFKGTVVTLLLSTIFVLLSSNLILRDIVALGTNGLIAVAVMLFVVRPLNIFASTFGADIRLRDKLFLSLVAPRGIIAASIASLFTFSLVALGWSNAGQLESLAYLTIGITVLLQGMPAGLIARILRVRGKPRSGYLIVGAHALSREIAKWLLDAGREVRLIDTALSEVMDARQVGLVAYYGNAIDEQDIERVDMQDIGNLLALTSNDEVNILACQLGARFVERNQAWRIGESRQVTTSEGFVARKGGRRIFSGMPRVESVIEELRTGHAHLTSRVVQTKDTSQQWEALSKAREIPLFYKSGMSVRPVETGTTIPKGSEVLWLVYHEQLPDQA